ncbi:hypothetical protein BB559_004518 [Furculomyces boomerangus]|uniref:Cation-transporting P-type ATPase N-terminal domain-containing protein n=1 Tax=Furculomyces boomerangus TaxID=61424 RepID=A0A2T9YE45_9FUNG|nr:hypothetical protein BB559_004518 [Furculomyces boomerangus]
MNDHAKDSTPHAITLKAYHTLSVIESQEKLQTNIETGLSEEDADIRLQKFGNNTLAGEGGVNPFKILIRQLSNIMVLILFGAAILSFAVKDYGEGSVLVLIIILNTVVGFIQEFKAEKTVDSLRKLTSPTSRALRNGHLLLIPTLNVVPGDILYFESGDVIGADCRLFDILNFETDEALLTGETLPVLKNSDVIPDPDQPLGDRINIGYASTIVTKGRAKGIVYATGMKSEVGKIAKKLMETSDSGKTKLNKSLDKMSYYSLGLAILLVLLVFSVNRFKINPEVLIYGISLAIAVIPEGLLAVLTLTMALGIRQMSKQKALVRQMNALEVLGSVTDICSDKTGTLTQSKMVLVKAWIPDEGIFSITGLGFEPIGEVRTKVSIESGDEYFNPDETKNKKTEPKSGIQKSKRLKSVILSQKKHSEQFKYLAKASALCNMSEIKQDAETGEWFGLGDPTEIALQVFSTKVNLGKQALMNGTSSLGESEKWVTKCEFSFDSSIKRMTVIAENTPGLSTSNTTNEPEMVAFLKGATEKVVECCKKYLVNGKETEITPNNLLKLVEPKIEELAKDGLRVVSLAYRKIKNNEFSGPTEKWNREDAEKNMVYIGMVGIYDPPRPESRISVEKCFKAGIMVHMLTGDHPATAAAIAKQVGIISDDIDEEMEQIKPSRKKSTNPGSPLDEKAIKGARIARFFSCGNTDIDSSELKSGDTINVKSLVMTARDFDALTNEEIDSLPELPAVIARCTPDTKVKLIEALHRRDGVVAMTGDGVNDSPSLKFADVGISMGMTGSDVAKQASSIILTDDNFSTIVRAVAEGRRLFTNIGKFIRCLIGANVAELVCLVMGLVFRDDNGLSVFPLSPVAILANNLLTGTPPAMALGTEKAADDNMENPPRDPKKGLFVNEVIVDILAHGIFIGLTSIFSFYLVLSVFGNGELGSNCNSTYNSSCETVYRARGTNFSILTILLLIFSYSCRNPSKQTLSPEKIRNFYQNKYLFYSFWSGIFVVLFALYVPGVNKTIFKHSPITWEWSIIAISIVVYLVFDATYKYFKKFFFKSVYLQSDKQTKLQKIGTAMSTKGNI